MFYIDIFWQQLCIGRYNSCATDNIFGEKRNKISLPSYPWSRQLYAFPVTSEATNKKYSHPLLGIKNNSIDGVWTCQIDPVTHPYLNEHVVDGLIVFPAACFIEIVLAGSRELFQKEKTHVEIGPNKGVDQVPGTSR